MSVKHFPVILVPDGDDAALSKMIRQFHHWTALDFLRTDGPKATGTGVSRVYDEDEFYKAVILEELVRLGVPAVFLEDIGFGDWLETNKDLEHWQIVKEGARDVYLNVASNADEGTILNMSDDPRRLLSLLGFVDTNEEVKSNPHSERYSSMIVVNVTTLFDRVPE
uniref:hypothetical protein n=1 Tax=Pararhizobium sp. IMCC3301 TaxID=3067904 RepID=UPI00274117A0|nr:hypothetical protein [Pararhizobium sp. IMCC3301]